MLHVRVILFFTHYNSGVRVRMVSLSQCCEVFSDTGLGSSEGRSGLDLGK